MPSVKAAAANNFRTMAVPTPPTDPGEVNHASLDCKAVPAEQQDASSSSPTDDWSTFIPPNPLPVTHPYLLRHHPSGSALLHPRNIASNALSTTLTSTFGNPSHPLAFTIGNGGAGYTGLLKPLCAQFIWRYGNDFRIGWVANHSRHSQIALLGGVVQVCLSYEPRWEGVMEEEGWGRVVGEGPVFWDHFVLVGPRGNGAGLGGKGLGIREAIARIAKAGGKGEGVKFLSRGDGSATFTKERQFWRDVAVDVETVDWVETHAVPPLKALIKAEEVDAYMLSDRSTYLTAKRDGVIPNLRVYVEGGKDLLNPCSVSVNTRVPDSQSQRMAVRFAEWLGEPTAQGIFRGYGRVWEIGLPLFTGRDREEFGDEEGLVGRGL